MEVSALISTSWQSENFLHIKYTGAVNGDELVKSSLELSGDHRFDELRCVLSDWYEIQTVDMNERDVLTLVNCNHAMAKSNPNLKVALVASKNNIAPQLISLYALESESGPWQIVSFADHEDANRWLLGDN